MATASSDEERYFWKEMMAVFFCRELEDGDRVASGANTHVTTAACLMAQKSHAPNLKLQLGGGCFLVNVADTEVERIPRTSVEFGISRWADAYYDHPDTFMMFGPPGGRDYQWNRDKYRSTNKYFVGDKFFVGGIQADRYGNVNLIGISDGEGGFAFRGPGTIGISDVMTVYESYIFLTAHTPERLVEKVDFVSYPGWEAWDTRDHFIGRGPKYIVTPSAVFSRNPTTGVAQLQMAFPGNTPTNIEARTGFEYEVADDFSYVPKPSASELALLRNEIDKDSILQT